MAVDVFAPKSMRVVLFLLLNKGRLFSQREICRETNVAAGLVSRVVGELVAMGAVKRPYRFRVVLEFSKPVLLAWIGRRRIGSFKAFFAKDLRVLGKIEHVHTLFSGAWLDSRHLKTGFTTVYIERGAVLPAGFKFEEGRLSDLKSKIVLIEADDDSVFYGKRTIDAKPVVNHFLLYVDLASFGGIAQGALDAVAEKHDFPLLK